MVESIKVRDYQRYKVRRSSRFIKISADDVENFLGDNVAQVKNGSVFVCIDDAGKDKDRTNEYTVSIHRPDSYIGLGYNKWPGYLYLATTDIETELVLEQKPLVYNEAQLKTLGILARQITELPYLRSLDIETRVLLSIYLAGQEVPHSLSALLAGVRNETLSRTISQLAEERKLVKEGRKIILHDSFISDYREELRNLSSLL